MTNASDLEERPSLMPADLHLSSQYQVSNKINTVEAAVPKSVLGCFLHSPAKVWLLIVAKDQCTELFEYFSFDLLWELHCSLQNKQ